MSYRTVYYQMSPRAMAHLDIPIANPYTGAAFGEKEKGGGLGQVIGVVAAVAAVTTGIGMMAAPGIFASLAGGAMVAGGVMQGLGTITGDKKMVQTGSLLTLAGGIGSFGADLAAGSTMGTTIEAGMENTRSVFSSAWDKVAGTSDAASAGTGLTNTTSGGVQGGLAGGAEAAGTSGAVGQTSASELLTKNAPQMTMNPNVATTNINQAVLDGANKASASKGILGSVMDGAKSIGSGIQNMGVGGGLVVSGVMQGYGSGVAAEEQAKVKARELDMLATQHSNNQAELARQIKNMNYQNVIIDPNSANAASLRAAAQAAGIPIITLGVTQPAAQQPAQQPAGVSTRFRNNPSANQPFNPNMTFNQVMGGQ